MSFKVNLYAHRPFAEYTSTRESGKLGQIQRKGGMKSPKSPEAQIKQTNKQQQQKPEGGDLLGEHSWFSTQEICQILKRSGQKSGELD